MTFVDHGIQGALLYAVTAKALGAPEYVWVPLVAYGFLEGSWPDVGPWVLSLFGSDRWLWYMRFHATDPPPPLPWRYLPAFNLHRWVDLPFHAAGEGWFPREWPRCIMWWLLELSGIIALTLV